MLLHELKSIIDMLHKVDPGAKVTLEGDTLEIASRKLGSMEFVIHLELKLMDLHKYEQGAAHVWCVELDRRD